ncbi:hypothetical protein T03_15299 [Trichinella britovi]|uniref:Uncharacterized protein n=1 Tax=Trichinella britovi TaxID=45882 RepID=A0A0V1CS35_TRIBR|nr:hypothetical protein T03_15299 [Trichinella britovi]
MTDSFFPLLRLLMLVIACPVLTYSHQHFNALSCNYNDEWQRFHVDFRRPCSRHFDGFCRFMTDICNLYDFGALHSGWRRV